MGDITGNSSERIVKDRQKRTLGGKEFATDTNARVIIDQDNARILIIDENGDNRVLIGYQEDGF